MPGPTAVATQVGNPNQGTVSRQPQTSTKPMAGAPFVRLSRKAETQGFLKSGLAYGGLVSQSLIAAGGYISRLILTITSSGGTGGGAVAAADAPWNVIQSLLLKDSLGQPIVQCDGWGLYLISKYSGQVAMGKMADPTLDPSYSAPSVNGNFSFRLDIPLELDSAAYCAIASLNAAAQPSITLNLASQATVFTTPPATLQPTLTVQMDQKFWAAPVQDTSIGPPDVGASAQWSQGEVSNVITTNKSMRLTLPRVGTWIHTLIACMRDNTGARVDGYPAADMTFSVDGVPVLIESFADRVSAMARFTDGISRDTGVIAYTFRDSVQAIISQADTHDLLLPTTPATGLLLSGVAGAIANSPATLDVYTGELYPVNADKVPYTHLAA